ncbi:MAG: hypothetical protein ACJ74Y_13030 [Bryobacteraceae bacterium]
MGKQGEIRSFVLRGVVTRVFGLGLLYAFNAHAQIDSCRCPGGAIFQPGLVNYKGNSDRELVIRIEAKKTDSEPRCEAAWIRYSEVFVQGTPYGFHLQRKHVKTIREDACGESPTSFVSRTKTYRFSPTSNSQSVREMYPLLAETVEPSPDLPAGEKSNANIWRSIATGEPPASRSSSKPATATVSVPEFVRTAWVLARKDLEGHYVTLVRGVNQRESVQRLNKTRTIRAGELGQIEASNGYTAIVRFYSGSTDEKFASKKNVFRRWYDSIGGPYSEAKDDLYSPLRACILEVRLEDIVEVNDFMDGQKTDET